MPHIRLNIYRLMNQKILTFFSPNGCESLPKDFAPSQMQGDFAWELMPQKFENQSFDS